MEFISFLEEQRSALRNVKYRFEEHCLVIKRYLLLGLGDFVLYMMDIVGPELSEPADTISSFKLAGLLESAIRFFCAIEPVMGLAWASRIQNILKSYGDLMTLIFQRWLSDLSCQVVKESKDDINLKSLVPLLKCLKIMENATFLSQDNQVNRIISGGLLDATNNVSLIIEAIHVISCGYEEKTEWGQRGEHNNIRGTS